jgi:hypothetical protein
MSGPKYHGWTHRPASEGGTDPIPVTAGGLTWAHAFASAQTITPSSGDYFFSWDGLWASDSTTFEVVDLTAGRGDYVQINTAGYYIIRFNAGGTSVWDNAFYTKITPMMEISGSPADLVPQLGNPDFSLNQFNSDSEMFDGETAHKILWEEFAFNWNPADPVSDIDSENPLKISFRVETVGATAAKLLQAEMHFIRIADAGYVDLSPV